MRAGEIRREREVLASQERERAAVAIQSRMRQRSAKRLKDEQVGAAIKVQAAARGRSTRRIPLTVRRQSINQTYAQQPDSPMFTVRRVQSVPEPPTIESQLQEKIRRQSECVARQRRDINHNKATAGARGYYSGQQLGHYRGGQ